MPDNYFRGNDALASSSIAAPGGSGSVHVQKVQLVGADGLAPPATTTTAAALPAGTDRSGSITTGGTAQNIAAANTNRKGLTFQNTSDAEMRVTESGTAASATTGYLVPAGGTFRASTNKAISVFGATAGKTFAATEW